MPNTAKGTPYVISTDLVADYPTTSNALATHIDDKLAYNAVTINAQTGTTYTFALADASAGKLVTASNAGSQTYTVPPQSSVTWADGAVLRILNQGAGVVTIAAGAGVTINGTPLTLNQYAGAALQRTASNTWTIIPFTGGVGNANFSDAATGTYTSGGIDYKYITYTASGTLTMTASGLADVLVIGGGGGGGSSTSSAGFGRGGGGAGGFTSLTSVYLTSGSVYTVTVGAGGAASSVGSDSRLGSIVTSVGGGWGGFQSSAIGNNAVPGGKGGSGGGSSDQAILAAGSGTLNQGNDGGLSTGGAGGSGGGGATAAGSAPVSNNGGAGGAGTASSITGASVTYSGGGGGGGNTAGTGGSGGGGNGGSGGTVNGVAGTANTGGGGGGASWGTTSGGAGGSGVVIIRVRTN